MILVNWFKSTMAVKNLDFVRFCNVWLTNVYMVN